MTDYRVIFEDPDQPDAPAMAGNALRWAAIAAEQKQTWATYRQALRDITAQAGFPYKIIWPTKPTEAV